jgi:(p)ppGpp synthase/HD superfamily hydrolase
LLTDCSAVVSEAVEIVKTGSLTTNEHATLVFLVQVTGLDCIQKLMDKIGNIRSVMSVERSFGSDLLQGTKEDSLFNTCTQSYPC